jgi:hypothetical protein
MPKQYELKKDLTSTAKVQRIVKTVQVNATKDREIATVLLKKVTQELDSFLASPPEDRNIDNFVKLVQSSVMALNQMGVANEKLLKLGSLLMKYNSDKSKNKGFSDSDDTNKSFFATLKDLTDQDD